MGAAMLLCLHHIELIHSVQKLVHIEIKVKPTRKAVAYKYLERIALVGKDSAMIGKFKQAFRS